MTAPLCIVVKGFPRISETFITRELEALQDNGLRFSLASLRRPEANADKISHRLSATPNYLPEYLHHEPRRVLQAIAAARKRPGFHKAWTMFRADMAKEFNRNRVRRFGQACVLAAELPEETRHLHAHFIHTPASVARYAAAIRDLTFSVSAHAKDIWTSAEWDLKQKLHEAAFVCTCNAAGAARLAKASPDRPPLLWPHLTGNLISEVRTRRSGPVRFLTVARAVPKKGLPLLLDALAQMPATPDWTWTHIGGGQGISALKNAALRHPYRQRLEFLGARAHADVLEAMRKSDVFVLTAQVADDGDRDGRPNALIEAMSLGLACVATGAGGIPEVLLPDAGLIVEPHPARIAATLKELVASPEKISSLGEAARARAAGLRNEGEAAFASLDRALRKASSQ